MTADDTRDDAAQAVARLLDEEPSGAVWEPAGLRFEVGDRVRIRVSAECRLRACPGSYYDRIGQVGHPDYEDGLTGTVMSWSERGADFLAAQGHMVDVEFDVYPPIGDGRASRGGTYALSELVALADGEDAGEGAR